MYFDIHIPRIDARYRTELFFTSESHRQKRLLSIRGTELPRTSVPRTDVSHLAAQTDQNPSNQGKRHRSEVERGIHGRLYWKIFKPFLKCFGSELLTQHLASCSAFTCMSGMIPICSIKHIHDVGSDSDTHTQNCKPANRVLRLPIRSEST